MSALRDLASAVAGMGGLLAETVDDTSVPEPELGRVAALGSRAAAHPAEYALLVEAIREGYLQHYGTGRVVHAAEPDLALLAGDRLYAFGLSRLAELGDLAAVTELADVISLAAQAQAEGDPARAERVWWAGARAVAVGTDPEHVAEKAAWRAAA